MKATRVGWLLLVLLVPSSALASRTELAGRGLPAALALDSSLLRIFPGSAGRLASRLEVDVASPSYSDSYIDEDGHLIIVDASGDPFVLALGGRSLRFGYLMDGSRHQFLLATPSGWGVVLGLQGSQSKQSTSNVEVWADTLYRSSHREYRNRTRQVRLGMGWQSSPERSRVFEWGLGAAWLDQESTSADTTVYQGSTHFVGSGWESNRGFAVDASLRLVTRGSGPSVAVTAVYEHPDPDSEADLEVWNLSVGVHAGWRIPVSRLDDFMFGASASWYRSFQDRPVIADSVNAVLDYSTTRSATRVFLSGERRVWRELTVRGGVQAGFDTDRYESESLDLSSYEPMYQSSQRRSSSFAVGSPTVFVGASWRWKSLTLDAQVRTSINTDVPVARWAAVMAL